MARYVVEEKMKRFFVDKITQSPVLSGDMHKHLSVVLRAKVGDAVTLCCDDGFDYVCKITAIGRSETILSLCAKEENLREPKTRLTLFMSVLKGDKNDLVVQKAVELGAYKVVPLLTRFTQGFERNIKTERLNKIAGEAAKQCGRSVLTQVTEPISLNELLPRLQDFDLTVFPYENAVKPSLKDFLGAQTQNKKCETVAVIIGSEGGFSQEEVQLLTDNGVVPVTLGKRILRAETANIATVAAVMYELGEWQ